MKGWFVIVLIYICFLFFLFGLIVEGNTSEARRQERIERIVMRALDLVERGHFTREEADKLQEALSNAR